MRLERSVDPPWIQCTTWCAALHFAGRSQPGQRQWPSRASSAWRAGPETVRLDRPTSITVDSDPSSTRVTPLSHANRSTVLDEIGSAKSISAAGASREAEQGFDRARDLDLRPLHGTLRQLDQGIGLAAIQLAGVILAGFASKRLQRRAHRRPTHAVEDSVEHIG